MASQPQDTGKPPIGDPPRPSKPVKAEKPMQDPFTEQVTRPAARGQGANEAQPARGVPDENDEDAWPIENGFGLIP
jgi:hypothetical protein